MYRKIQVYRYSATRYSFQAWVSESMYSIGGGSHYPPPLLETSSSGGENFRIRDQYFFLLISIKHVTKKVNITQPIKWRLEKPNQPIREAGKFEIFRAN